MQQRKNYETILKLNKAKVNNSQVKQTPKDCLN